MAKRLPFIYNMVANTTYSYIPAYKQFGGQVKVARYPGWLKPWVSAWRTSTGQMVSGAADNQYVGDFAQKWVNTFRQKVVPLLPQLSQDVINSRDVISVLDIIQTLVDPHKERFFPPSLPHEKPQDQKPRDQKEKKRAPAKPIQEFKPPWFPPPPAVDDTPPAPQREPIPHFESKMSSTQAEHSSFNDNRQPSHSHFEVSSQKDEQSSPDSSYDSQEIQHRPHEDNTSQQPSQTDFDHQGPPRQTHYELNPPEHQASSLKPQQTTEYQKGNFGQVTEHIPDIAHVNDDQSGPQTSSDFQQPEPPGAAADEQRTSQPDGVTREPETSHDDKEEQWRTKEQENNAAYQQWWAGHRYDWEHGHIDYMGHDSFSNILKKLEFQLQVVNKPRPEEKPEVKEVKPKKKAVKRKAKAVNKDEDKILTDPREVEMSLDGKGVKITDDEETQSANNDVVKITSKQDDDKELKTTKSYKEIESVKVEKQDDGIAEKTEVKTEYDEKLELNDHRNERKDGDEENVSLRVFENEKIVNQVNESRGISDKEETVPEKEDNPPQFSETETKLEEISASDNCSDETELTSSVELSFGLESRTESEDDNTECGSLPEILPGSDVGDFSGMYDWQEGRVDWGGRHNSEDIMKRLDFIITSNK